MLESFQPPPPVPSRPHTPDNEPTDGTGSFSGDELVQAILRGEAHVWSGRRISGDVSMKGLRVESSVEIHGAVFSGTVNFSQTHFEHGVDLGGCVFQQKVNLSDAWIDGPLILDDVVIGTASGTALDVARIRLLLARLKEMSRHMQWQERLEAKLEAGEARRSSQSTVLELDNLRVEGCLSLMRASVGGGLSCNHAKIENDMRIDEVQIHGPLSLRHTSLGELRTDAAAEPENGPAKRCLIEGDLNLTSATVTGDIRLVGITVGGKLSLQTADIHGNVLCRSSERLRSRLGQGAWLVVARVKGNVDFRGARLYGDLNLSTATIGGNLQCNRGGIWHLTLDGHANVENARIGAYVTFEGCRAKGSINLISAKIENDAVFNRVNVKGCMYAHNALIGGNLYFLGARIESLELQNASIGGTLFLQATLREKSKERIRCEIGRRAWLLGVNVAGNIDLSGSRIGDVLVLQNASISQNLIAHTLHGFPPEIDGGAYLSGARIHGFVEFGGVALRGNLELSGASVGESFHVGFDLDEVNGWRIVPSCVGGSLDAEAAVFGKGVILMGLTVGSKDCKEEEVRGVSFVGARINGDLSFHSKYLAHEIVRSKEYREEDGTVEMKRRAIEWARQEQTVIHGGLWITRAHVLGGILLDGVTVLGDLDLRDATVRANINCRPMAKVDGGYERAFVRQADFETLDMTGNVDLTGLTIDGDLNLRNSRIRGRLELYPFGKVLEPTDNSRITNIGGKLKLDAAEISHVIFSGRSLESEIQTRKRRSWRQIAIDTWRFVKILFGCGQAEEAREVRVGLDRARIGQVEIVQQLPRTLDLSDLRVDHWDLPNIPSSYRAMLECSYPFKRSNYLAIENALRNAGEDEQADEVHVWMRRRDCRSTRGLKVWLEIFLDLSIKYGTTSKRLLCLMVILFAVSVWCFSNPNHMEYKVLPVTQVPPPVTHPIDWNLGDAALYATRLHVPIISLGVEEDMQPSGFAMKSYAMATVAASWVMWPLLLASVSGLIRKRP